MVIRLKGSSTLHSINQEFTSRYPFLRLGFYFSDSNSNRFKRKITDESISIVEAGSIIKDDEVECHYWQSTRWVERQFSKKTGLDVQIMRQYKDCWIRTDGSDLLTLEEQNEMGMMDSVKVHDYHGTRIQKSI